MNEARVGTRWISQKLSNIQSLDALVAPSR